MSIHYMWMIAGLILAAMEFIVPGFVIVFFGVGAFLTGILAWIFPNLSLVFQILFFTVLSLASLFVFRRNSVGTGAKIKADSSIDYDDDYIGGTAVVVEAISASAPGKVEFNGANWNAESSSDLAPSARVKIVSRKGLTLIVEPIV